MRSVFLATACALICGLAACSKEQAGNVQAPAASGANEADVTNNGSLAADGGAWALETSKSTIDGQVYVAKRMFTPDEQTNLLATVQCIPGSGEVGITIDSYLGSEGDSLPGSAFSTSVITNWLGVPRNAPVGRAKPNDHDVMGLGDLFALSDVASNEIVLMTPSVSGSLVRVSDDVRSGLREGDVNFARVVADMLPLSIELNTESGKHELVIDKSPQVAQALNQCGASGDVVKPEGMARMQAATAEAERKAEEVKQQEEERVAETEARTDAQNREYCRSRGSNPIYKAMCEAQYPEEFAAFQKEIDDLLALAKSEKRCKLNREDIESNASSGNIGMERNRIMGLDRCSWLGQ